MWSVLAHPEKMLKAARGCLWWTLIVTLQTLTSCLETLHHFISSTGLTREETKLSAEAGRFTRQVLIHNKPNLQVNMLHWQLLTFSHQHSARISGNLQRWNWFLGACEEKCEPIPNQERRERGKEAEWRERGESGKVMAGFPAVFEGNQRPKQRGTGINRYILCDVGKGWKCVCMSCMCVFVCIFMCVCVCRVGVLSVQCFIWRSLQVFPAHGLLSPGTPPGSARSCPCPSWCRPARLHPGTPCAFAWEDPQSGS